jgi:hypothetical protein
MRTSFRRIGGIALFALAACMSPEAMVGESHATIQLTNTLSLVRENEIVEIPLSEVRARYPQFDEHDFSVHLMPGNWYPHNGDPLLATDPAPELPAQVVDTNFDGTPDSLLVICDFAAGEQRFVAVASPRFSKLTKKIGPRVGGGLWTRETTHREGGKFTSEGKYTAVASVVLDPQHAKGDGLYQCGGPVYETDSNAWRLLFDSRMCYDVIGKRERGLFLQSNAKTFLTDSVDLTKTTWGSSLMGECEGFGAGGFGYADKGTIVPTSSFDSAQFRMLQNGPAAVETETLLLGAKLGKDKFDLRWRVTQYAGSRILRHDVEVSRTGHALAFAMNASAPRVETPSGQLGWMRVSSFGPTNVAGGAGGSLGLGIVANGRSCNGFVQNPTDVIGVQFDPIVRRVRFYSVAAWDKEPAGIRNAVEFQKLLDDLALRLENPISIQNLDKDLGN